MRDSAEAWPIPRRNFFISEHTLAVLNGPTQCIAQDCGSKKPAANNVARKALFRRFVGFEWRR